MTLIERLQIRLGELKSLFEPAELEEFLSSAQATYEQNGGKDDSIIIDLALSSCYLRLATNTATYFSYTQADESVDKSMTPEMFLKLYQALYTSAAARLGIPIEPPPATAIEKPDTFIMRKNAP